MYCPFLFQLKLLSMYAVNLLNVVLICSVHAILYNASSFVLLVWVLCIHCSFFLNDYWLVDELNSVFSFSLSEKTELFLELYGNLLVRKQSADYVEKMSTEFIK